MKAGTDAPRVILHGTSEASADVGRTDRVVDALAVLQRDVVKAATKAAKQERKEKPPRPGAVLSNPKAAQRDTLARHLDGRPRPGRY